MFFSFRITKSVSSPKIHSVANRVALLHEFRYSYLLFTCIDDEDNNDYPCTSSQAIKAFS